MSDDSYRIAVCQIETHPAFAAGDTRYLAEPFLSARDFPKLSELARYSVDLSGVQDECESRYLTWQNDRLNGILQWVSSLNPCPDILVFPEFSVPLASLSHLRGFAATHRSTVFAGTHLFDFRKKSLKTYKSLRLVPKRDKDLEAASYLGKSVLPVFSRKTAKMRAKVLRSIGELTEFPSPTDEADESESIKITMRNRDLAILPLVCSEALQSMRFSGPADLVVILGYSNNVGAFEPTILRFTQNGIPVVFCNDGRYGGSGVFMELDNRPELWWWSPPHNGKMPAGDSVLVVDIAFPPIAPQRGVVNPHLPVRLGALASIVHDFDALSRGASVASTLQTIAAQTDSEIQHHLLGECLATEEPTRLQDAKLHYLQRCAQARSLTPEILQTLAHECVVAGIPDIKGLEAQLADMCGKATSTALDNDAIMEDNTLGRLAKFRRQCNTVAGGLGARKARPGPVIEPRSTGTPLMIDRLDELASFRRHLQDPAVPAITVIGLPGIGKSTLIAAALSQGGYVPLETLPLASDASPQFIISALARTVRYPLSPEALARPETVLDDSQFADRFPPHSILLVESTENLLTHGEWRVDQLRQVLMRLMDVFARKSGHIIFESSRHLDFGPDCAGKTAILRLKGVAEEFGSQILESSLRRLDLDPSGYPSQDRKTVSGCLGGHPAAIVLAADYISRHGFRVVLDDLQGKQKIHTEIVQHILKKLTLDENTRTALAMLDAIRAPISLGALHSIVSFNLAGIVLGLWRAALVERHSGDRFSLASVFRGFSGISGLPAETRTQTHRCAATFFAEQANSGDDVEQLRCAIEARYHASLCREPDLAPDIAPLTDGLLGALQRLVREKNFEAARPVADQLLAAAKTPEALRLAAEVYARLGLLDNALVLAKQAVSEDSKHLWILGRVGSLALHVHKDDIADEVVEIGKNSEAVDAHIHVLEGRILRRRGDISGSIECFERAVQASGLTPHRRDSWPHFYLGRAYLQRGYLDDAIDTLCAGEVVESSRHRRRPLLTMIRSQLATAYLFTGDTENASRLIQLAEEEDAQHPDIVMASAFLKAATGAQVAPLEVIQALDPTSGKDRYARCHIHLYRALLLLRIPHRERAAQELAEAHREDGRNLFVLLVWAKTLLDHAVDLLGNGSHESASQYGQQAKQAAEKVLHFDRGNKRARDILERLSDRLSIL